MDNESPLKQIIRIAPFECEYVTAKGCYFGKLIFQDKILSFMASKDKIPDTIDYLFSSCVKIIFGYNNILLKESGLDY